MERVSLKNPKRFRGVIFDMDGVLVDSEPVIRACAQEAAFEMGFSISNDTYISWMGLPSARLRNAISSSMGPKFPIEDFYVSYKKRWKKKLEEKAISANPGIKRLLKILQSSSIPISVATSTAHEQAIETLRTTGLLNYFDTIVGGDNVEHGKPAPDIFKLAAETINVPTNQCIGLEDSEIGVKSAVSAGLHVIMIPDLVPPNSDTRKLPKHIVNSTIEASRLVLRLIKCETG
jgi:HAD superfamily hydrolase (TIGR01509 family)